MRILILTAAYPPTLGGLQTTLQNLALGLAQRTPDLRIITNRYPRSLSASEVRQGIRVERLLFLSTRFADIWRGRPDLFLASFYYYPQTYLRLQRLLREFQPDVVNIHYPDAQLPFLESCYANRKFRLVVSLHGYEVERWITTSGAATKLDRDLVALNRLFQKADVVTACSDYLLQQAAKVNAQVCSKGRVIYNGVDGAFYERPPSPETSQPYILAYGRFTREKGFDLLLKAFAEISKQLAGLSLIIAGDGEDSGHLKGLAQDLGLGTRVVFFGRAEKEQLLDLLRGAQFVVVPSRRETFGMTALEAMAAGRPVLATRVGGLPELVQGPANILVEPTPEGLTAGILELWRRQDDNETGAPTELNRVQAARFTLDQMVEGYWAAYQGA